jgi:single-strand DNA-binding protein
MQKVTLIGHLGRDPEERFTSTGQKVSSFSLAVAATKNDTVWYECVMFGMKADVMATVLSYLKKGSKVCVTGALRVPEIYQAKDGSRKIKMSVDVDSINFVQSAQKEDSTRTTRTDETSHPKLTAEHDYEELPF